ncbi:hypothetical protein ABZW32_19105 [Streptomyces sp. NPDC004667]|uniref:hypothetical protein n=1 Tax=Streptomyces sp. NPDC004667 TaxID=3154285 RepID=UPI0033A4DD35
MTAVLTILLGAAAPALAAPSGKSLETGASPYSFQTVETGEFVTPAGTLKASGTALFLDGSDHVFVLDPADVRLDGDRLVLTGTTLSGSVDVSTTKDPQGRTVHKVEAAS